MNKEQILNTKEPRTELLSLTIEQNSYGSQWGDQGRFYTDLKDINDDIGQYGAYAITKIPYTPKDIKKSYLKQQIDTMILALKGLMARENFYKTALKSYRSGEVLVKDDTNTPYDDQSLGCAIAFSKMWSRAFPNRPVSFTSTSQWHKYCRDNPDIFEGILSPEPMCIILSPTDSIPPQSPLKNGHVGIVGKNKSDDGTNWVLSNNSKSGKLDAHYTVKSWNDYYNKDGRIPTYYYKIIS